MRRRRTRISVLLSVLLLVLVVPTASAGATRTDFVGFVFPAGYPGTATACGAFGGEYGGAPLPACVLDEGKTTDLGGGRTLIRNKLVVDIWFLLNEPLRTGYVREYFNANLDASLSGPVWGSWEFYSFGDELMFTGHFSGRLDQRKFTTRGNGIGVDAFKNQHVWLDVFPALPEYPNMSGQFLEPGSD